MNLYQKYLERAKKNNISVQDEMFSEYKKFILQATREQTNECLKDYEPGRLQVIRKAMEQLDHYFNSRDYQNFMKVINDSLKELSKDIY